MQRSICLVNASLGHYYEEQGIDAYCRETAKILSKEKWNVTVLIDGKEHSRLAREFNERHRISIQFTDNLVQPSGETSNEHHIASFQARSQLFHEALVALMNETKRPFDLIEFSDRGGTGFIPIQMKKSLGIYAHSRIIVKLHGSSEWLAERAGTEWTTWDNLINEYVERYSFENANVQASLSSALLDWCRQHGWKIRRDVTVSPSPFHLTAHSDLLLDIAQHHEIVFVYTDATQRDIDEFIRALHRIRKIDLSFPQKYQITLLSDNRKRVPIIAEETISRRLEPYKTEFRTFNNREDALACLKTFARLTILAPEFDHRVMLDCIMNRIPFVTIRREVDFKTHSIKDEVCNINRTNWQNLPKLVMRHTAFDRDHLQDLVDATYREARTLCQPRRIVQWYQQWTESLVQSGPETIYKPRVRVTVIVPTRNASKYLPTALQSLNDQTYRIAKIIIKDSSTDPEEIVKIRYLAKKYQAWLIHRNDTSIANAMNQGLRYADTKYIVQFDSDNIAKPHMIESLVRAIQIRNDVAALSCYNAQFYDEDEPRLLESFSEGGSTFTPRQYYRPVGPCIPYLFIRNVQGDATSIYLTKVLKEIGGWPEDRRGHEDWLMWLKLVGTGCRIDVIPEVLYYYRVRPDSASRSNTKTSQSDRAQVLIIQEFLRKRPEMFSDAYSSLHRLLRENERLEQRGVTLDMCEKELDDIRNSLGYKFTRFYASRIDQLLPDRTRRGQLRKDITAYLHRN